MVDAGGVPLSKPREVIGDQGYDSDPHRMRLSGKGIRTSIARQRTRHGSGLGVFRRVVERTISWLTKPDGCGCGTRSAQNFAKPSLRSVAE